MDSLVGSGWIERIPKTHPKHVEDESFFCFQPKRRPRFACHQLTGYPTGSVSLVHSLRMFTDVWRFLVEILLISKSCFHCLGRAPDSQCLTNVLLISVATCVSPVLWGAAVFSTTWPLSLKQSPEPPFVQLEFGSKLGTPKLWMVNTKLDIHICGPINGLPFWPTSSWNLDKWLIRKNVSIKHHKIVRMSIMPKRHWTSPQRQKTTTKSKVIVDDQILLSHYIPTTTHCCLAVYNTGLSPFLEFDYIMILIVFSIQLWNCLDNPM